MKSRFFVPLLLAGMVFAAHAGQPASRQNLQALRAQAGVWLETLAAKAYPETQALVGIGPVDERLRLSACAEPQFFLPSRVHPWGNGSLGVRCEGEAKWSLYLTFQVRLRGPALVVTRSLPAKAVPSSDDLVLRLLDYQQSPESYLREFPADARLARPLAAGQPILLSDISQPDVIRAGQKIRVIATGSGFQASHEGTALGNAAPGDVVKVKMPSGRIVQGIATADGQVSVAP